jgi:bacteriocin-like protein
MKKQKKQERVRKPIKAPDRGKPLDEKDLENVTGGVSGVKMPRTGCHTQQ